MALLALFCHTACTNQLAVNVTTANWTGYTGFQKLPLECETAWNCTSLASSNRCFVICYIYYSQKEENHTANCGCFNSVFQSKLA